MRNRWAGWLLLVAAAFLAGACGVPPDSSPHAIQRGAVPYGLLSPSIPTTTTTTVPTGLQVPVRIYLTEPSGRLIAVARDVSYPAPLSVVVAALLAGPTGAEAANGFSSAIPAGTRLLNATDTAGVATVDLGGNFGQLAGAGQVLAVAQIVFTVTELAGIHAVAFTLDGQAIAVPAANGAQVDTPVTRSQYASLAPD